MTEETLIWTLSALVIVLVVVPYATIFRRRARRDSERKHEARRLGIDVPVAQFPWIDGMRCIGCGACVDACPEGDVLGVVTGTATVVNGLRCIGHGECATACPVGAIEVGTGDLRLREDVPLLDEHQETSIPGLFVAGELGGLALIRNAIEQGRRVGAEVASRAQGRVSSGDAELIVIGAGPAGLSAALAAVERGLRTLVLEQEKDLGGSILHYPRRKLVLVQPVDIPFGAKLAGGEHGKEEILAMLQGLIDRARLDVRFGSRVDALSRVDGLFHVRSGTTAHRSPFVLLALGRRGTPRKLGVPGEELPKVSYALIDAESYRNTKALIVGGGDSAVEAAIGLARQAGNEVTLSYRREKLVRIKQKNEERLQREVAAGRVRLMMPSEVAEIRPASVRLRNPAGVLELDNEWVFVFAGGDPPFDLLRRSGVRFGGAGTV